MSRSYPCRKGFFFSVLHVISRSLYIYTHTRGEYEGTALVRLIGLHSSLFKTHFEDFPSMQQYVDHILSIAEHLETIDQPSLADNVVGGIILIGLPDQFKPLILCIL